MSEVPLYAPRIHRGDEEDTTSVRAVSERYRHLITLPS